MRCLKKVFSFFLSMMLIFGAAGSPCSAFDGPTHKYVTEIALEIVDNVFGEKTSKFYTLKDREQIGYGSVAPDNDENQGAYKDHFYNPVTELNFMGEVTSAKTKCVDHFNRALHYMKLHYQSMTKGDLDRAKKHREKAMEEIGRSLHFLQDLNTPVHTNNQTLVDTGFNFLSHVSFENTCKKVQDRVRASMQRREFYYYEVNSVETIGIDSALTADDNLYGHHKGFLSKEKAAENSINGGEKSSAGVFYKFCLMSNELKRNT